MISIHKQVVRIALFYITRNSFHPFSRRKQFVTSFPCKNGWIILIRDSCIHIDVIEENADVFLKVTDDLGIRVKCLLIASTTPICKGVFTAMIVMPVIDEWNDQSYVIGSC